MPGGGGAEQCGSGGHERAEQREQGRDRAHRALWPVKPERGGRSQCEQAERKLDVEEAAAERRDAHQRHEVADRPDRPQRELGGCQQDVDGGRDEGDPERDSRTRSRRRAGVSRTRVR